MNTLLRKSINEKLGAKIPKLLENAISIMKSKYPNVSFDNIDYEFSGTSSRSRYYRNRKKNHLVSICTRAKLYLYDKKSLKIEQTKLFVGSEVQIMCAIIHELTHHMQYETKIPKGELETTRNELEYLKENYIKYYNIITGIK